MPESQQQQEEVLSALLGFATGMLERRGEVYPFAATLDEQGRVELVSALTAEERAAADPQAALTAELRRRIAAGGVVAAGVCGLVRVERHGGLDAIQAVIEHRAGEPVAVLLPYRREEGGRVAYAELVATTAERAVFTS